MDKTKSIYDPCPAGWRVPDGGSNGIWSKALGSSSKPSYDSDKQGMNFSIYYFGSASNIWYPALGYRDYFNGSLDGVGESGYYWSASPNSSKSQYAYILSLSKYGNLDTYTSCPRACGLSVRCIQESK